MKSIEDFILLVQEEIKQYHFPKQPKGLYEPLDYFLKIGGKRLRPVLTLLGADLFGGDIQKALKPAMGIELFHNFTLVHDDIMDDAPLRRGQSTVHEKWNLNTAILSGDVLFVDAFEKVSDVDQPFLKEVLKVFVQTAREVCEGQQKDMDFESELDVTEEEYIHMIQFKTSVLLGCALQIGAIISGAAKSDAEHLYQFGLSLGTSFQIKDDYLDAFGDPEKFGKQVGGDIISNKKTILLIKALEFASAEQKRTLLALLNESDLDQKVRDVKQLYNETGSSDYALAQIENYYQESIAHLDQINTSSKSKERLYGFADWLKNRDL
jgi:geranylgeranyl diphosphate synthase type II